MMDYVKETEGNYEASQEQLQEKEGMPTYLFEILLRDSGAHLLLDLRLEAE